MLLFPIKATGGSERIIELLQVSEPFLPRLRQQSCFFGLGCSRLANFGVGVARTRAFIAVATTFILIDIRAKEGAPSAIFSEQVELIVWPAIEEEDLLRPRLLVVSGLQRRRLCRAQVEEEHARQSVVDEDHWVVLDMEVRGVRPHEEHAVDFGERGARFGCRWFRNGIVLELDLEDDALRRVIQNQDTAVELARQEHARLVPRAQLVNMCDRLCRRQSHGSI